MLLFCNIDADAGFELDREVIGKDGDLLDETFNTILVKVRDGGFLPGDEVLQLLDPVHGFFPAVAVHLGFFFLLPEPENLVGDGVIILLVVGLFDKLLLEFYHPCLNAIRRKSVGADHSLGDVLLHALQEGFSFG